MSLFTIDHHVYFHGDSQQNGVLALIIEKQNLIISKLDQVMALTEQQFTEVFDAINTATNQGADYAIAIGQKIDALKEDVRNQGLSAEAENRILGRATSIKDSTLLLAESLRAMAADETNPVPIEPPVEPNP